MRYLHTMLRVRDLDAALDFYCNKLGLKEVRRRRRREEQVHPGVPGRARATTGSWPRDRRAALRRWSS